MLPMFALKNVAFFGHMDGWEYQDRVMALCSFMCDALCSVFPKTSNQAWGWAVSFWRIFNWKVKISTRPRDKSCCHSPQPPPHPPSFVCVSLLVYICRSPSPSTFICYFFPETQGFWVPLMIFPNRTQLCQLDLPQAGGGGDDLWCGSSWHSPADGAAGFAPLLCTVSCLASVCLN